MAQFFTNLVGRNSAIPVTWSSTYASLQRFLFDCRDSLLVVDDLKTDKTIETAEEIIQSQGNLAGRQRMNPNGTLQPSLDPGGSLVSTGEIDPKTKSVLGRALIVELGKGDIDLTVLTNLQRHGDDGCFGRVMASFIKYLAPSLEPFQEEFRRLEAKIGQGLPAFPGSHPRHPDAVASLAAGHKMFLDFVVKAGAISGETAEEYFHEYLGTLIDLGSLRPNIKTWPDLAEGTWN